MRNSALQITIVCLRLIVNGKCFKEMMEQLDINTFVLLDAVDLQFLVKAGVLNVCCRRTERDSTDLEKE